MFIGHFALSFAAKRTAPRTSLGATFVAGQLADMLWPIFLLLGIEQVQIVPSRNPFLNLVFTHYPWSHSLLMQLVWGAVLGCLYFTFTRYGRGAVVLALLVPTHWLLDLIVHVPDLPLYPGASGRMGFGLWRHPAIAIVVELALFAWGVSVYLSRTHARDRVGRFGLYALVLFLLALYAASVFSPPPSSVSALAWGAMIGWPLTLWPWWIDRHREPVVQP
jgi:hypothetical protein